MSTIDTNAAIEDGTPEGKFFGVRTEIVRSADAAKLPDPEITIEDDDAGKPPLKKVIKPTQTKEEKQAADDAELATHSAKVQKRIKKMRWQQGEVERERDALKAERDEAFRVAQNLHGQNQRYVETITTGEARLVSEMKQRATNDVALAKADYATAYEKGDTAKIIEAQEKMLNANADFRIASNYETDYERRTKPAQQPVYQPVPQVAPVQRQVPSVPKPTEGAASWAEENPWFGNPEHPDMTALAYGVHEKLIKQKHIAPDTDEYFEGIDSAMQKAFPKYFTEEQGHQPATVVGSGQRQSAAKPRKITLKPSQVRLAKRLGLTVEQYANQLIKDGI